MRRRSFVASAAGLGVALLASCAGDGGGGGTGTFRLLISDQPAAIEQFDSLDVTLSSARVFRAGDEETVTPGAVTESPGSTPTDTTDGGEGFVEFDLEDVTVDLTQADQVRPDQ